MTEAPAFAAVDLGAESGRVMVGALDGRRIELHEVHRFANRPVRLPDGLRWDVLGLLRDTLDGLSNAGRERHLAGIGVDSWGVDYGLLDAEHRLLSLPFHYRDSRTEAMMQRAFARLSRERMFAATGIQTLPINTAFQLLADEDTPALSAAQAIAFIPDLMALWLSGELANEATIASTSGLVHAGQPRWSGEVIEALGVPSRLFGELVEPGTRVGSLLEVHARDTDVTPDVPVYAVAGHDTASAFAAAPMREPERCAVLCSGTWSLLGVELDEPQLGEAARDGGLTNERGVDATVRLLKNVMGLWLLQECRRAWGDEMSYGELLAVAAETEGDVPLFDADDEALLAPGDMPARIAHACRAGGQHPPQGRGELVRSILVSLACKYRLVLEHLEQVTGRAPEVIHVVGGGAHNQLLCQLTADICARPVLAGPVEASAMGNVLMQARAERFVDSLAQMRALVIDSVRLDSYQPTDDGGQAAETYERFLSITGLQTPARARTR